MKIVSGIVKSGRVVIEGDALEDGTVVTVLAPAESETFSLMPEAEDELLESIREADADEVVTTEELFRQLTAARS